MKRLIAERCSVPVLAAVVLAVGLAAPSEAALATWVTSVQSVQVTLSGTATSGSATLSSGTVIANCVPFASFSTDGPQDQMGRMLIDVYFQAGSPPSVVVQRNLGLSGDSIVVNIAVVEFNSANVRVQQNTFQITSTTTSPTLGTAVDTGRAAMVFYARCSVTGGYSWPQAAVAGYIDTSSNPSSTLNFTRGGTGATLDGHYYVFEALGGQFAVQQGSCSMASSVTYCDVVLSSVDMSKTFVMTSYRTASNADPRFHTVYSYLFSDSGTLKVRNGRGVAGANTIDDVRAFAVTFASDGYVQRNYHSFGTTDTQVDTAINSVETATAMAWGSAYTPFSTGSTGSGGNTNLQAAPRRVSIPSATVLRGNRGALPTGFPGGMSAYFEAVEWKASPTAVEVVGAWARRYGSRVRVDWQTGFEVDNLGFHVYREVDGRRERVTPELVAGTALLAGGGVRVRAGDAYALWDDAAREGGRYWLEAWDLSGERTWHGPFEVEPGDGDPPGGKPSRLLRGLGAGGRARIDERPVEAAAGELSSALTSTSAAAGLTAGTLAASIRPPRGELRSIDRQWLVAGAGAVKLAVRQDGWTRAGGDELLAAGLDPAVDPDRLVLYGDGVEVPIDVVGGDDGRLDPGDAVEWYGQGLDTVSTDTRVYYLVVGEAKGQRIESTSAADGGIVAPASFPFEVAREDKAVHFPALKNGEEDNFFGPVLAGEAVSQSLPVHHLDPGRDVSLAVRLQGVSDGQHRVGVRLNGRLLGSVEWLGDLSGEATFPVAAGVVVDGTAVVVFEPQSSEGDVSLIDRVVLRYGHVWAADAGVLTCTAPAGAVLTIGGFPAGEVHVVDVTDPHRPIELEGRVAGAGQGRSWSGAVAGEGTRRLLAFAASAALRPAWIRADRSSSLWAADGADLVVIGPADLLAAVEPLIRLRESEGLEVLAADIDDVFDEFGAGACGPEALRRFLFHAATAWDHPARYALLVGDSTVDPRDYLGLGAPDLVPTKLIEAQYLETASDEWLGDFDGDGLAELTLGRLPVGTVAEAATVAGKIVAHDAQRTGGTVVLVADVNDEGNDFEAASGQLRELVPAGVPVTVLNRSTLGDAASKALLVEELGRDGFLVNYVGHGSVQRWSGNVLTAPQAAGLSMSRLTVALLMTCLNGYFHDPSLDSLAEALLKAPLGGAAAVWASTGLTEMIPQALMDQALLRSLFAGGEPPRLGDAIRDAKAATDDRDVRATWVLLGDPTMTVQ